MATATSTVPLPMDLSLSEKVKGVKEQLDSIGWAVIDDVIPPDDCEEYVRMLAEWKDQFSPDFPSNSNSLIHEYNISHHEVPWQVRLQSKGVFAELWGTQKLLSSTDGIAIGQPPESGNTRFEQADRHSLHHDQGPQRRGLHAYQGAVYLEEALQDDWCFAVLENSHQFHEEFFESHSGNPRSEYRSLSNQDIFWYAERGCYLKRLAVPKGGMVLWDSRTVHMSAPPKFGRQNPGRWRYVVFVSMVPAVWASPSDLAQKKTCYEGLRVSRHWPANGYSLFRKCKPQKFDVTSLPAVAKTIEAQLIAGVLPYDFEDGSSNGPACTPVTLI